MESRFIDLDASSPLPSDNKSLTSTISSSSNDKHSPSSSLTSAITSKLVYDIRNQFPVFKKFEKLHDAVNYAKTCHQNLPAGATLPVFALDYPMNAAYKKGSKSYYCASYNSFADSMLALEPLKRNFYETILPDIPSKLYLDVEFCYATNRETVTKDQWLEQELFALIEKALLQMKIIQAAVSDLNFTILDSSNAKKFSKHYIISFNNNKAFANNYHCGAFMRHVEQMILLEHGKNIEENPFYVWDEKETQFLFDEKKLNKKCIVDMGVYDLYRQMRTVGCVKAGETDYANRTLRPQGTLATDLVGKLGKQRILDAMIQRVPPNCQLIYLKELDGSEPKKQGNSLASRRLRFLSKEEIRQQIDSSLSQLASFLNPSHNKGGINSNGSSSKQMDSDSFSSSITSDPDMTNHLKNVTMLDSDDSNQSESATTTVTTATTSTKTAASSPASFSRVSDSIQSDILSHFPDTPQLSCLGINISQKIATFNSRSHNCANHGMHKNNHVYYVCYFTSGQIFQKCKDPDCFGFKSKPYPISQRTRDLITSYLSRLDLALQTPETIDKILDICELY